HGDAPITYTKKQAPEVIEALFLIVEKPPVRGRPRSARHSSSASLRRFLSRSSELFNWTSGCRIATEDPRDSSDLPSRYGSAPPPRLRSPAADRGHAPQ